MAKVYEFLADGFEELEALAPVDIFRRAGVEILTVSCTGRNKVVSSHGVGVMADMLFDASLISDASLLILPGGMPGTTNLNEYAALDELLLSHAAEGKPIGAICAAPMILGRLGLLRGKRATCSPGFEKYLLGAQFTGDVVTTDGDIVTAEGPAAAMPFSYALLRLLGHDDAAERYRQSMRFKHLCDTVIANAPLRP